ncbi:hypothetical protein D3C80_1274880 [compost metagenome]
MADGVDHLARIIDSAIVSAELNDRQAERPRLIGLLRGYLTDLLTQIALVKTTRIDAADKTKRVARGFQIHRRCPSLDQRTVVIGFMVIAIEQHQIATRQQRVGHHFIGGRSTVQHEVGFISVEHFRRVFLRILGRAFMDQQIAQLHIGVAHVRTENRFAVKLEKLAPCRVLAEKLAALMARAGKG